MLLTFGLKNCPKLFNKFTTVKADVTKYCAIIVACLFCIFGISLLFRLFCCEYFKKTDFDLLKSNPMSLYFKYLKYNCKNHFVLLVTICTFALPKKYKI